MTDQKEQNKKPEISSEDKNEVFGEKEAVKIDKAQSEIN